MIGVSRARFVLVLALATFLGAPGCRTLRPVVIQEGPLTDGDLKMAWTRAANRSGDNFSEQFRIEAVLDDGGELFTKLTVTNIAKYDGRAELSAKIQLPAEEDANGAAHEEEEDDEAARRKAAAPTGPVFRTKVKKDRGDWTAGNERFEATVGDCTVVAGVGFAQVHAVGENFVLDYTVETDLPALRPPGGVVNFGGAFYATTIPIPRGRLVGTLVTRGPPEEEGGEPVEETIDLEGWAYIEHRATDLAPYRMAKRWFKMREHTLERTVVLSAFERTEELGGQLQGWVLVADEDGLQVYEGDVALTPRDLTLDGETGYGVPGLVFLESKDGPGFRGVVRSNALTERRDDLRRLSAIERVVVRRLMKPFTFIFDDAEFLFRARVSPESAEDLSWRGETTFEYQQLNSD
ncbi:MAG: hypothetical protein EP329_13540 [Deltaproteobacteria bacterium]|nr:MAG: hypothetical protein EP329_13540 [Deltaproteobacteria bacterium]